MKKILLIISALLFISPIFAPQSTEAQGTDIHIVEKRRIHVANQC